MFQNEQDFSLKEFFSPLTTVKAIRLFAVIGIAVICVVIYLYTAAPFMLWEDAPRFLAAIVTLGIAEPAEPVYVFLAHWFTYLPFGSVVFRIQVFSALLAGGSLLLLYRLVVRVLKLPAQLPKKTHNSSRQRLDLPSQVMVILAGICSMLVLAFSYEFWSQAQNVETFILDCFIELIVLTILLSDISKTIFTKLAIVVIICGIATGTNPPVIASVFPLVLYIAWYWRAALGIKRLAILFFLGISGIVLAWSYLPIMELHNPRLHDVNGKSLEEVWKVATGGGLNVYDPNLNLHNGLTWAPEIIMQDTLHYLVTLWITFTPVLLPLILAGGIYLWRSHRRVFTILMFVVLTNFVFCSLYHSGNEEAWTLQSDVVFALFAGAGAFWLTRIVASRWPDVNFTFQTVALLFIALVPLGYWWTTLDRHSWHFTQDYIYNLYRPLKEPAILVGTGDLWNAVSGYVYDATNYKPDVVPVQASFFYLDDWRRHILVQRSHIRTPDTSLLTHSSLAEYRKFMNDFFALNLSKYHIYITQPVLHEKFFEGSNDPNLRIDEQRFALVPVGMVEEVIPKFQQPSINLNDFTYHFGNGFPQTQPYFLERTSIDELQEVSKDEIARSYSNAANYLVTSGQGDKAATFYTKAYALNPKDAQILTDMGIFYGKQNDFTTALTYFTRAHTLEPDNQGFLYNLAVTEGYLGEVDKEKKYLQSIVNSQQPDPKFEQPAALLLNKLNQ